MRSDSYKTKQRDAIYNYIVSLNDQDVTAAQIVKHFTNHELPIGRSTVFRFLGQMTDSGMLRRYTIDGKTGSFYQLADQSEDCNIHFHLKCEQCGRLEHLDCDELELIEQHVSKEHAFQVNMLKTVFYGKCKDCLEASIKTS